MWCLTSVEPSSEPQLSISYLCLKYISLVSLPPSLSRRVNNQDRSGGLSVYIQPSRDISPLSLSLWLRMSAEEDVELNHYVVLVLVLTCLLLLLTITLILCCLTRSLLPRPGSKTRPTPQSSAGGKVQRDSQTQTLAGRPPRPPRVQMGTGGGGRMLDRRFLCGLTACTGPDYEEYQYDRRLHPPSLPPPLPYLYSWVPPPTSWYPQPAHQSWSQPCQTRSAATNTSTATTAGSAI